MLENQVFEWNGQTYRLLKQLENSACLYPLSGKTVRELKTVSLQQINAAEENGEIQFIEDPYLALRSKVVDGKAKEKADANYALIADLVNESTLFDGPHERAALVQQASGGDPVLKRKIYRLLNTYWLKGQVPNALTPEYGKRTREATYKKKPGRRNAEGPQGTLISEEIRAMFDVVCRKHLLAGEKESVAGAYRLFLSAFREAKPDEQAPSLKQFRYYFDTRFSQAEKSKGRHSKIGWAKDARSLTGTAKGITAGIGDCYEIDSTTANQSLVSEADPSIVVDRPTIWSVVDRASGLIVGIHVTLEPPSLQGALDALYNAFMPKKAYCAKFGIDIEEEDWPASGLPNTVISDNAELLSNKIKPILESFGVWFENAASYRADSKGTVESSLGRLQELARPILPKTVNEIKKKKAGGGDLRLNSKLTLREYTAVMILMVLIRNKHLLETTPPGFPISRNCSPIACWQWAREVKTFCCLRSPNCTPEQLRLDLLVKRPVTVSEDGLCCEGFYYDAKEGRDLGWFDRGKGVKRPTDMLLAINPDDISTAWLFAKPNKDQVKIIKCTLGRLSQAFAGMSLFEARKIRKERAAARRRTSQAADAEAALRINQAQKLVQNAGNRAIKSTKSKAQRLREIGENKSAERIRQSKTHPRIETASGPAPQPKPVEPQKAAVDPLIAYLALEN